MRRFVTALSCPGTRFPTSSFFPMSFRCYQIPGASRIGQNWSQDTQMTVFIILERKDYGTEMKIGVSRGLQSRPCPVKEFEFSRSSQ
ncbi:unnamed protein product, partial [Nesidiocoris tenuis]